MQRRFFMVLMIFAFSSFTFAQKTILDLSEKATCFASYADYKQNKSIRIDELSSADLKDAMFHTDKLFWGVSDQGKLYRFVGKNLYRVEDTTGLVIYAMDTLKTTKTYNPWLYPWGYPYFWFANTSHLVKSENVYFSKDLQSEIKELNLSNLELVTQNPDFMKKARKKFRWINYDIDERYNSGQYMVNRLYNKYAVK